MCSKITNDLVTEATNNFYRPDNFFRESDILYKKLTQVPASNFANFYTNLHLHCVLFGERNSYWYKR